jgi:hypothetical protein
MAFGVEELCVLRRALAVAVDLRPARAEDVQDCLRLAESLDEAMREGARLRTFLVADLARYREALPGTASGYLALLTEALDAGHRPGRDDLAALRALRGSPAAAALLRRCGAEAAPAERAVPAASAVPAARAAVPGARALPTALTAPTAPAASAAPGPYTVPGVRGSRGSRGGGGGSGKEPARKPARKPGEHPAPRPAPAPAQPAPSPAPETPKPGRRPVPTPGEVFPPRKPTPPPASPEERTAARFAAVPTRLAAV